MTDDDSRRIPQLVLTDTLPNFDLSDKTIALKRAPSNSRSFDIRKIHLDYKNFCRVSEAIYGSLDHGTGDDSVLAAHH